MTEIPFRTEAPLAWTFHRNSMRWAHSVEPPGNDTEPLPSREDTSRPLVRLPPVEPPRADLFGLLRARYSCRLFDDTPVSLAELSTILSWSYGTHGRADFGRLQFDERPAPSGGGLYPLELTIYARSVSGLAQGLWHYVPTLHGLEQVLDGAVPKSMTDYLFMGQHQLTEAPLIVVASAAFHRSLRKYGDRGYRYVLLEAGHVIQNVNLLALALGLGSCNIGGFFDMELADVLALDPELELPLYATAVGHPRHGDRNLDRGI